MVIRADRDRVAEAIAAYMRGAADNFALSNATLAYSGQDRSILQIGIGLWGSYDDIRRHGISVDRAGWKRFRRCLAFLETNLELPRRGENLDAVLWPFQSRRELIAARPRLGKFQLPAFDPSVHSVPVWSKSASNLLAVLWVLIGLALAFAIGINVVDWLIK